LLRSIDVSHYGTYDSADLGNSSNYSNEASVSFLPNDAYSFEGRGGEGFLVIGEHARVSRS